MKKELLNNGYLSFSDYNHIKLKIGEQELEIEPTQMVTANGDIICNVYAVDNKGTSEEFRKLARKLKPFLYFKNNRGKSIAIKNKERYIAYHCFGHIAIFKEAKLKEEIKKLGDKLAKKAKIQYDRFTHYLINTISRF